MNLFEKYKPLFKGANAIGIELFLTREDSFNASVVFLKKRKRIIEITQTHNDITSFDNLISIINKDYPVYLSLDGKGIIHKSIQQDENSNDDTIALASKYFPNFTENVFFAQKEYSCNNKIHLSLIRDELLSRIIDKFISKDIYILQVTLGPFSLHKMSDLIKDLTLLSLNNHQIHLMDGKIESISKSNEDLHLGEYSIDSEVIKGDVLVAYSNALGHFILQPATNNPPNKIIGFANDFIYKKAIKTIGIAALVLIFIGLIINFFLFESYNSRYNESVNSINQIKWMKTELESLQKEITNSEYFFTEKLPLEASKVSYYADQISSELPLEITLEELAIHPIQKTLNRNNEILFSNKQIIVTGSTSNTQALNSWINAMKNKIWIKEINLLNLQQPDNNGNTIFKVEIIRK